MKKDKYGFLLSFLTAFPVVANIEKGKLLSKLNPDDIERLLDIGVLTEEKIIPKFCSDGSRVVSVLDPKKDPLQRGKYLLRCESGRTYELSPEEYENKYTIYRVEYQTLLRTILDILEIPLKNEANIESGFVEISDESLAVVLLTNPPKTTKGYFRILSRYIRNKKLLILIGHDKSLDTFLEILKILPLGNSVYFIPFSLLLDEYLKSDLAYWIEISGRIEELEEKILNSIQPEHLRKLMVSIETNPRYLLSLLSNLKTLKLKKMPKFDEYFENISSLAFRYLYGVDVTFGGSKNRGLRVPDSIVYIRDLRSTAVRVIGIVDAKSSLEASFNKEPTEKYGKYISYLQKTVPFIPEIVFIFVVFGVNLHSLIDLHGRLMNYIHNNFSKLENRVHTVIVPIDSLEVLLKARLSIIIREAELSESGLDKFFLSLFTREYLERTKKEYQKMYVEFLKKFSRGTDSSVVDFLKFKGLYLLPPEIIIEELDVLSEENSSLKALVKELRKLAQESRYYFC